MTPTLGKAEIEAVFAPELRGLTGPRRVQLTGTLVGVGFWPFWESLRTDVGASPEQAQDIVVTLLTASLTRAASGGLPGLMKSRTGSSAKRLLVGCELRDSVFEASLGGLMAESGIGTR